MTAVAEVLSRYQVDVSEADVAAVLEHVLQAMPSSAAAAPSSGSLAHLAAHGGPVAAATVETWSARSEQRHRSELAVRSAAQRVSGTLSIDEVAELLHVDGSRVRHYTTTRPLRLHSVKVGHRRRIPAWQIHQGSLLPGLPTVIAAIPAGSHPLDISALMTTPQDELDGRSPIQHLAGGGDPSPVAQLIADVARW